MEDYSIGRDVTVDVMRLVFSSIYFLYIVLRATDAVKMGKSSGTILRRNNVRMMKHNRVQPLRCSTDSIRMYKQVKKSERIG